MRNTVTDNHRISRKNTERLKRDTSGELLKKIPDGQDTSRRTLLASSLRSISTLYLAPATLMLLTAQRATAQSVTPSSYTIIVEVLINDWNINWVNENGTQQGRTFNTNNSGSRIKVLTNTQICWSTSDPQPSIQYGGKQSYSASGCFDVIQSNGLMLLLAQHP